MHHNRSSNEFGYSRLWKGIAAGLAGGLAASWVMNRFQDVWSRLAAGNEESPDQPNALQTANLKVVQQQPPEENDAQDDTTVRTASLISERFFHHKLTPKEKKIGGTAVHYSLGTGVGGLYGAASEFAPEVTVGLGMPFGAAFWLVVDEGAVPLLGLSKGPAEYPLSTHFYALTSHLVYGLTAEVVRRTVRDAL